MNRDGDRKRRHSFPDRPLVRRITNPEIFIAEIREDLLHDHAPMFNNQGALGNGQQPVAPNPENIALYIERLRINTRMSQDTRTQMANILDLNTALTADNNNIAPGAQHLINREMAKVAGTAMSGPATGQYIANCMDTQAMGIPPPPAPTRASTSKKSKGGKKK